MRVGNESGVARVYRHHIAANSQSYNTTYSGVVGVVEMHSRVDWLPSVLYPSLV